MAGRWSRFVAAEPLSAVLARHRGIGPGFDFLRIALATTIFAAHAKWICGTSGMNVGGVAGAGDGGDPLAPIVLGAAWPVGLWQGPVRPFKLALVPMFFALSGFLVTGSALRLRATSTFVAHRLLRIVPALAVEVFLSAFLLGPVFTSLPPSQYFQDARLWRYFGNIVGDITYFLPDVFVNNPAPRYVNMSLWTLQTEYWSYLMMTLLLLFGILYKRRMLGAVLISALVALALLHYATGYSTPVNGPYATHVIVSYMAAGILLYAFADRVPFSWILMAASAPVSYLLLLDDVTMYLAVLPLAYLTICLGLCPLPRLPLLNRGDYSYGVYLYAFPVSQALIAAFPAAFVRRPLLFLPAAYLVTLAVAVVSWTLLERHALTLKRHLPERWFPSGKSDLPQASSPA